MNNRSVIAAFLFVAAMTACATETAETIVDQSSDKWKIEAFSSAASQQIADGATVLDKDGTVLREGSNGWTCMSGSPKDEPDGGWDSVAQSQPVCADQVGLEWMKAYMTGASVDVSRDAYLYMLQGDLGTDTSVPGIYTEEDATSPENWVVSGPHLMLMPKDPTTLSEYPVDPNNGEPYLMWPGSQYAHLMIPVE